MVTKMSLSTINGDFYWIWQGKREDQDSETPENTQKRKGMLETAVLCKDILKIYIKTPQMSLLKYIFARLQYALF